LKPEVSIILPFRNAGETIRECMNSILAQSYTDWELIAIDDHSTDTSAEIIRGYSHEDSRIKCLNTPGVGIADALNFGVEKANSGIIARMDSDDLMRSTRLEEQLKYLTQKPAVDLVSSEVLQISDMAEGKIDWLRPLRRLDESSPFAQGNLRQPICGQSLRPSLRCLSED
jgi:glycosyltransferase involved in cell wall biosynthesis